MTGRGVRIDAAVALDWSAAARPVTGRDSVWWALHRRGADAPERLENPPTRAAAMAALAELLAAEAAAGRRVLLGCDFPFGWPEGGAAAAAAALGGGASAPDRAPWRRLWAALAAAVDDGPDNANNRFELAARINMRAFDGAGPFWGRPHQREVRGLPARKPHGYGARYPRERRAVEGLTPRAQPVWKLYTTGSVGGQALLGIAALERLRSAPGLAGRAAVWPFEALAPSAERPILIAEIYPSLFPPDPRAPVKDAGQVRAVAERLAQAPPERLAAALAAPACAPESRAARGEEGWILGVGPEGSTL